MNYCITVFQGLIFSLQCMPKFEAFTLSQALPVNNTRKVVNRTVDRRQGSGESTVGAIRRNENERGRLGPTWGPSYRPHYGYEPYWAAGNWVNKEAVKPPTKEEFVKFIEYNGTGPTPEGYRGTEHCPIPCPKLYSESGPVCARTSVLEVFEVLSIQSAGIYYIGGAEWIHRIFEGAEENKQNLIIDDFRRDTDRNALEKRKQNNNDAFNNSDIAQWKEDYYYAPTSGYEPYWKGGDWVLVDWDQLKSQSGVPTYSPRIQREDPKYCEKPCPEIFLKNPTPVCGARISYNQYVTFKSMCEFLQERCDYEYWKLTKHPWQLWRFWWWGLTWQFLHEGPCTNDYENNWNISGVNVGWRLPGHLQHLGNRFLPQNFNFTPIPLGQTANFFRFPF
ncbi:uncharacterized protein LOC113226696 [Hyposmocoma kahamanoa]|uniref:uncharacterized protein LOC113226696 n=1 Tax=Hyposmocoma kahamanoa TaxID=1477025 RepID=UPI000E6D6CC8|nr:uncharacterized protein LOC113226696 [Hyposmocoma kahamanoa]